MSGALNKSASYVISSIAPARPVEQVSWSDCAAFINKANEQVAGLGVRLPTEAEWEYGCRGGSATGTYAGDLDIVGDHNAPRLSDIAWYGGNSGVGADVANAVDSSNWDDKQEPHTGAATHPVGEKRPNGYGLYDMLGNVWEWCEDWFGDYPMEAVTDPKGPERGGHRVLRGGSWNSIARNVRAANRTRNGPGYRHDNVGVRLARGQDGFWGAERPRADAEPRPMRPNNKIFGHVPEPEAIKPVMATANGGSRGPMDAVPNGTSTGEAIGRPTTEVSHAPVATVVANLRESSLVSGGTTSAIANLRDAENNALTGRVIVWTSSNRAIATVNASTGAVLGVAVGTCNITATCEGVTGTVTVRVVAARVATVSTTLAASAVIVGTTSQGRAVTRDASNNVLTRLRLRPTRRVGRELGVAELQR